MSGAPRTADTYRRLGTAAQAAHEAVGAAFRDGLRDRSPGAYTALLKVFHEANAAALPSTRPGFMTALAEGRRSAIDDAVAFLEADPWFFRSGYEKQNLLRQLKRIPLSDGQKDRLATVVLAVVQSRDRQEFRHYCRLARVLWSSALEAEIVKRLRNPDADVRRRAGWVYRCANELAFKAYLYRQSLN